MPDTVQPDIGRNFIGDMEPASLLVAADRCLVRAPLTDAVQAPGGCASVGMLMSLVDIGASDPALVACTPDWTATLDLSVHGAGWLEEGPVVVDCRLVRVGKKVIVVSAEIYDGRGVDEFDALQAALGADRRREGPTLAARSLITFARLPRAAASGVDDYYPGRWLGKVRHRPLERRPVGTMYDRMPLRVLDATAGVVELDRTSYVANSIGTINGGAQAVLAQVAAEGLRPDRPAVDR